MTISTPAVPVTTAQLAQLPTHDPMIGRIVGRMMENQRRSEKPEVVYVDGSVGGSDQVLLTFQRQKDGSVSADGHFGSLEVHEVYTPVAEAAWDRDSGNLLFGVAGDQSLAVQAKVSGTVGGQPVKADLGSRRSAVEVALTGDLEDRGGKADWSMGSKVHLYPSFGGQSVETNLVPARFPTATTPIRTADSVGIHGKVGDISFNRGLSWNTTTWTVTWNTRDGWEYQSFRKVEDGALEESCGKGEVGWGTTEPLELEVGAGPAARTEGFLVGEGQDKLAVSRAYSYLPQKRGVVHVEDKLGDSAMKLDVYIYDPQGNRAGLPSPEESSVMVRTSGGVQMVQG